MTFALSGYLKSLFIATDLIKVKSMMYVLDGLLKEYLNKMRTIQTRTKLTETTLITPTCIHTNETKHQNKVYIIDI